MQRPQIERETMMVVRMALGLAAQRKLTLVARVRRKRKKGPLKELKDKRERRERERTLSLFHTSPNALKHTGHECGLSFSCTLRSCTLSVQRSAKSTEHTNACTVEKGKDTLTANAHV